MFFKLGIKQLKDNWKVMLLSVITVSIGVGIFFTVNVTGDTLRNNMELHMDSMFGNVDYTVYRSDGLFFTNPNKTIDLDYMEEIRSIEGVKSVVARVGKHASYYDELSPTKFWDYTCGLNLNNSDERQIGIGAITNCLDSIGDPENVTIEDVLEYGAVERPAVISYRMVEERQYDIGDTIKIMPLNATKAYATPQELMDIENNVTSIDEVEESIRENLSRIVDFTIVGIIIDGSEAPEKPVPDKDFSFTGFMPNAKTIYIRMNDSFEWVFNERPGEISHFLVDVEGNFPGASAFEDEITAGNETVNIVAADVKALFQDYIDYVSVLVLVILVSLTVGSWVACFLLIKTITDILIRDRMREIGILRANGFSRKATMEIFLGQLLVISAVGTAGGLLLGLVPPQFFDLDILITFVSYNKVYPVTVEGAIVASPASITASIISGMALPFLFAISSLKQLRRKSIVEMMSPEFRKEEKRGFKITMLRMKVTLLKDDEFRKDIVKVASGERDLDGMKPVKYLYERVKNKTRHAGRKSRAKRAIKDLLRTVRRKA